jgi:hypothetical protein
MNKWRFDRGGNVHTIPFLPVLLQSSSAVVDPRWLESISSSRLPLEV